MVTGYKAFNSDWTCRSGFQYEVGKSYEMEDEPIICERGFHFCKKIIDCFTYYDFKETTKIAEIVANGVIATEEDTKMPLTTVHKFCTNRIFIVREIPWHEVLSSVNIGVGNYGYRNSGNYNTGNQNSGNYNTGHNNSGSYNEGIGNVGKENLYPALLALFYHKLKICPADCHLFERSPGVFRGR